MRIGDCFPPLIFARKFVGQKISSFATNVDRHFKDGLKSYNINSFRQIFEVPLRRLYRQGHTPQTYIEHGLCTGMIAGFWLWLQPPSFRARIPGPTNRSHDRSAAPKYRLLRAAPAPDRIDRLGICSPTDLEAAAERLARIGTVWPPLFR
jgi:hypothetical protein